MRVRQDRVTGVTLQDFPRDSSLFYYKLLRLNIIGVHYSPVESYFSCPNWVWVYGCVIKLLMSLKYRRSILFDQPQQTTAKLALETVVFDYKQRLQTNPRATAESERGAAERMTAGQARCIEGLQAKLKTISFHTLYKQYHRNSTAEDRQTLDPEKLQLFRSGKYYRCSQRPREDQARGRDESRRREMLEYFDRQPEEETESATEVKARPVSVARVARVRTVNSTKRF